MEEENSSKVDEEILKTLEEESKFITIDEETLKEQRAKLPKVPPELFETMVDNTGVSVAEYNRQGFKVLLFFMSYLGCVACQGTLDDIVDLQEQLLLLNVIPIVVHNESQKTFDEWAQETERTQHISKNLLHLQRTKEIKKHFKLKSVSVLQLLTVESFAAVGNPAAGNEAKRLASRGIKGLVKFVTKETAALLAACYVVSESQVVLEFNKDRKYQRFDLARICIDTDGTGIEVHTDIYSCPIQKRKKKINPQDKLQQEIKQLDEEFEVEKEIMKLKHEQEELDLKKKYENLIEEKRKKLKELDEMDQKFREIQSEGRKGKKSIFVKGTTKSESEHVQLTKKTKILMEELLENPKYRKFFKTFATREYSVESIIFYEEVEKYKKMNEKKRLKVSCEMYKLFLEPDGNYEINTSNKLKKVVLEKLVGAPVELFDDILKDLVQETISNIYSRFIVSDLYQDLLKSTEGKPYKPMYLLVK